MDPLEPGVRCDYCGKEDAVIQLTKVKDNEMQILHLCESCAADEGVETTSAPGSAPLADFLAQIGKSVGEEASALGECPSCGMTPAQLKQTGRLGCAECYTHFAPHLRGLLRRLHGGTQHVGKEVVARSADERDRKNQVDTLRRRLQRAVDAEDFETAAQLRDEIHAVEQGGGGPDEGDD
jgi:protein arginine kinase activator